MVIGNYVVRFAHLSADYEGNPSSYYDILVENNVSDPDMVDHITICRVMDKDSGELISTGYAFQKYPDNFCRKTGRRISLTKALKNISSKNDRGDIWCQYFNCCK